MTIQNISASSAFSSPDRLGGRDHNELVFWHNWFCRVVQLNGQSFLVLKSYEGPELRFGIDLATLLDPETGKPFGSAGQVEHAVVCALHNSVRLLIERALGNRDLTERSGWYSGPQNPQNRQYGYNYLDWADHDAKK